MQLIIPFSEIPEHGVHFEINDLAWFPEQLLEGAGPAAAHIQLTKKQENKIYDYLNCILFIVIE